MEKLIRTGCLCLFTLNETQTEAALNQWACALSPLQKKNVNMQ